VILHAVACAHLRLEERAAAGLEQHGATVQRAGKQRPAGQVDAVVLVRPDPPGPHGLRCIAEHRTAVELLGISADGPEFHAQMLAPGRLRIRNPVHWIRAMQALATADGLPPCRPGCADRCRPAWRCRAGPTARSAGCPTDGWTRCRGP